MNNNVLIKINSVSMPIYGNNKYVSGVGRAVLHLLDAIHKLHVHNLSFDISLYASGASCLGIEGKKMLYPYRRFIIPQSLGNRMSNLESWYVNNIYRPSILHIPHNFDPIINKIPSIVTMHDTHQYDQLLCYKNKDRDSRQTINEWRNAANNSIAITTCSHASKVDLLDRFNVDENKITVIPWGVSHDLFKIINKDEVNSVLAKLKIFKPYFLAVSCSNERKNIRQLLKSYKIFAKENKDVDLNLVWSNPPIDIMKEYSSLIAEGRIKFLEYLSDEDLVALYNGANCTMFPSRYEGFGFPILESYACGTPVMTCRNSSLEEVGGQYADYVGEDSTDEMISVMRKYSLLDDKSQFHQNIIPYVKTFSWRNTAVEYLNLYKKFL